VETTFAALKTLGQIAGGLALFLYGMGLVSAALKEGGVARLRVLLQVLARKRPLAVVAGIVLTVLLSSSATAGVLLVSLVDAGVLAVNQALAVMMGSAIGTTITVQFFAFDLHEFALLILAVGFLIWVTARYTQTRQVGSILMGIGLIFLGMQVLTQGVGPLVAWVGVEELNRLASAGWLGPLVTLAAATALGAVLMNSAAVVVLAFALVESGLELRGALPIVFGANVGTCAGQLIAGFVGGRAGRQLAVGHLLFKVAGVLIFLPFLGPFASLVCHITAWMNSGELDARAVANAHTLFNVAVMAIFLPLLGFLVWAVRKVVPESTAPPPGTLEHVDYRYLGRPAEALERAHQEILRMGAMVEESFARFRRALERDDARLLDIVEQRDDLVDLLDEILTDYLAHLPDEELSENELLFKQKLLYILKDLEHIGDVLSKEVVPLARKELATGVPFAMGEEAELRRLHHRIEESFSSTLAFLSGKDPSAADRVLAFERTLDSDQRGLYYRHLERIAQGVSSSQSSGTIFVDLVEQLRRVHGYLADIVRVLEWSQDSARHFRP